MTMLFVSMLAVSMLYTDRSLLEMAVLIPVFWVLLSGCSLGARNALRRAIAAEQAKAGDPLKRSAAVLARVQSLTRSALRIASVSWAAVVVGCCILSLTPFWRVMVEELFRNINLAATVLLLCIASFWALLEIVIVYLRHVGDGKFALGLDLAAGLLLLVLLATMESSVLLPSMALAGFGVCLVVALVRMRRVLPWMPEAGGSGLKGFLLKGWLDTAIFPVLVILIGGFAQKWSWGGYPGGSFIGYCMMVPAPALMALFLMEMLRPVARLERDGTDVLASVVSLVLLAFGVMCVMLRYFGLNREISNTGMLFRMQFFFAAGLVMFMRYAKQSVRILLAEAVMAFGACFVIVSGGYMLMLRHGMICGLGVAVLCLPELIRGGKMLIGWLKRV